MGLEGKGEVAVTERAMGMDLGICSAARDTGNGDFKCFIQNSFKVAKNGTDARYIGIFWCLFLGTRKPIAIVGYF